MNKTLATRKLRVIENKKISERYKLLQLEKQCDFKAGQIIGVCLQENLPIRMYSITSGEKDETIDILYSLHPTGAVTPQLWRLNSGDSVYTSAASGHFAAKPQAMTWIAAGTGIAPFVSMIRSGKQTDIQLIHGARQIDDFYNSKEFTERLSHNYIQCLSGQSNQSTHFDGRVSDYLRRQAQVDCTRQYLLCGGSEMVVEVRDLLLSKGVSFLNISAEIYF